MWRSKLNKFSNFLKNPHGGVILLGREGTGVYEEGRELAEQLLNCDAGQLDEHPDFIEVIPDGTQIKLSQMDIFKQKVSEYPKQADYNVFLIKEADRMNEYAQNSILKVLEDRQENIFLLCCNNRPIETIQSRCVIFPAGRDLKDDEINCIANKYSVNPETIMALCDGRYQWLEKMESENSITSILDLIKIIYESPDAITFMDTFGVLKEKGDCFFDKYSNITKLCLIKMISNIFTESFIYVNMSSYESDTLTADQMKRINDLYCQYGQVEEIIDMCLEAQSKIGQGYSKNDFFDLVRKMIIQTI